MSFRSAALHNHQYFGRPRFSGSSYDLVIGPFGPLTPLLAVFKLQGAYSDNGSALRAIDTDMLNLDMTVYISADRCQRINFRFLSLQDNQICAIRSVDNPHAFA